MGAKIESRRVALVIKPPARSCARLKPGRVRVFEGDAVLLHGFIKKSEKIPLPDLKTAKQRKRLLK